MATPTTIPIQMAPARFFEGLTTPQVTGLDPETQAKLMETYGKMLTDLYAERTKGNEMVLDTMARLASATGALMEGAGGIYGAQATGQLANAQRFNTAYGQLFRGAAEQYFANLSPEMAKSADTSMNQALSGIKNNVRGAGGQALVRAATAANQALSRAGNNPTDPAYISAVSELNRAIDSYVAAPLVAGAQEARGALAPGQGPSVARAIYSDINGDTLASSTLEAVMSNVSTDNPEVQEFLRGALSHRLVPPAGTPGTETQGGIIDQVTGTLASTEDRTAAQKAKEDAATTYQQGLQAEAATRGVIGGGDYLRAGMEAMGTLTGILDGGIMDFAQDVRSMPPDYQLEADIEFVRQRLRDVGSQTPDKYNTQLARMMSLPHMQEYMAAMRFRSPEAAANYLRAHFREYAEFAKMAEASDGIATIPDQREWIKAKGREEGWGWYATPTGRFFQLARFNKRPPTQEEMTDEGMVDRMLPRIRMPGRTGADAAGADIPEPAAPPAPSVPPVTPGTSPAPTAPVVPPRQQEQQEQPSGGTGAARAGVGGTPVRPSARPSATPAVAPEKQQAQQPASPAGQRLRVEFLPETITASAPASPPIRFEGDTIQGTIPVEGTPLVAFDPAMLASEPVQQEVDPLNTGLVSPALRPDGTAVTAGSRVAQPPVSPTPPVVQTPAAPQAQTPAGAPVQQLAGPDHQIGQGPLDAMLVQTLEGQVPVAPVLVQPPQVQLEVDEQTSSVPPARLDQGWQTLIDVITGLGDGDAVVTVPEAKHFLGFSGTTGWTTPPPAPSGAVSPPTLNRQQLGQSAITDILLGQGEEGTPVGVDEALLLLGHPLLGDLQAKAPSLTPQNRPVPQSVLGGLTPQARAASLSRGSGLTQAPSMPLDSSQIVSALGTYSQQGRRPTFWDTQTQTPTTPPPTQDLVFDWPIPGDVFKGHETEIPGVYEYWILGPTQDTMVLIDGGVLQQMPESFQRPENQVQAANWIMGHRIGMKVPRNTQLFQGRQGSLTYTIRANRDATGVDVQLTPEEAEYVNRLASRGVDDPALSELVLRLAGRRQGAVLPR